MELLPLFRRCGTGPSDGVMRRIQPLGRQNWPLITDPAGGISVAVADMLILAEEVHAFEEENDMVRRVAAGPGASKSYDWGGMTVALMLRIHDHGLVQQAAYQHQHVQHAFAQRTLGDRIQLAAKAARICRT